MDQINEEFQNVKRPREAVLDSASVNMIANIGRLKAQALSTEFVRFSPAEFASRISSYFGCRPIAHDEEVRISANTWAALGRSAAPLFASTPPLNLMLGSFERGPRAVRERQPRTQRAQDSQNQRETVPNQLTNFNDGDKCEATTEEVDRVLKILKSVFRKRKKISFFEFVINPDSFGHSVENLFYVSFLVRDGLAEIFIDEDLQIPMIRPADSGRRNAVSEEERSRQRRHQTVISLTPGDWKKLVTVYKVRQAQIPPRVSTNNGNR